MCEACQDSKVNWDGPWERVPAGAEFFCDDDHSSHASGRSDEPSGFDAMVPARWVRGFACVDLHLCDVHAEREHREDPGLTAFLEETGLGSSVALLRIPPGERCEADAPGRSRECGAPARWAHVISGLMYACERHKDA